MSWKRVAAAVSCMGVMMSAGVVLGAPAPTAGDFDEDDKKDFAVYANGMFYILGDQSGPFSFEWGYDGVIPLIGDFDGDGRADMAVFDPNTFLWYIAGENGVLAWARNWGFAGVVPVAGDVDGDGADEFGVYDDDTGKWYFQKVNGAQFIYDWGFPSTQPVVGDFNGDGTDDLGVYHGQTGDWFVMSPDSTVLAGPVNWGGFSGAAPLAGNFFNNGRDDLAIYHAASGQWHLLSIDGASQQVGISHGFIGALGAVGDYDGDGQDDLAVYHEASGNWYVLTVEGTQVAYPRNWGFQGAEAVGVGVEANLHLPILTAGEGFLYKPGTHLVLLPPRMRPNGSTPVNRVVAATDPAGENVMRELNFTGNFHSRPKWRFYGTAGSSFGRNFYMVAFFRAGGAPQPYLIRNGSRRQD